MEGCLEYILIKWFMLISGAFARCFLSEVRKRLKNCSKFKLKILVGG